MPFNETGSYPVKNGILGPQPFHYSYPCTNFFLFVSLLCGLERSHNSKKQKEGTAADK